MRPFILLLVCIFSLSAMPINRAQEQPATGRIVFSSNMDGDFEIYVMNDDGSDVRQLTFNEPYDGEPDWSPDGTQILFVSTRVNGARQVFVMNADGSNQVNLSDGQASYSPNWSPNGNLITYVGVDPTTSEVDIFVMNVDGTNKINLTNTSGDFDTTPAWSLDGTQIYFFSTRNYDPSSALDPTPFDLFVMNTDGTNVMMLFYAGWDVGTIDISPSGDEVLYDSPSGGTIVIRTLDGVSETRLVLGKGAESPMWSPEGERIIARLGFSSIAILNRDGTDVTYLITDEDFHQFLSPDWYAPVDEE